MDYTEIIYLFSYVEETDEIGNVKRGNQIKNKVYAKKKKVGTKEYYSATSVGITPSIELQIRASEYGGEQMLEYNNEMLYIIRTLPIERSDIELVCSKKQGITAGTGPASI